METGYLYFVSYSYNKGFGNCYVTMETSVVDIEDVMLLGERSRKIVRDGIEELVIINFILLKEYEYEKKEADSID